jgi:hypothetical protein
MLTYMYNLDVKSLSVTSTYRAEAVIDGTPALGSAYFSLR